MVEFVMLSVSQEACQSVSYVRLYKQAAHIEGAVQLLVA